MDLNQASSNALYDLIERWQKTVMGQAIEVPQDSVYGRNCETPNNMILGFEMPGSAN